MADTALRIAIITAQAYGRHVYDNMREETRGYSTVRVNIYTLKRTAAPNAA